MTSSSEQLRTHHSQFSSVWGKFHNWTERLDRVIGWLSQTRPFPRSHEGDNKGNLETSWVPEIMHCYSGLGGKYNQWLEYSCKNIPQTRKSRHHHHYHLLKWMRNVCKALVAKMPIARYKKVLELLCMQLLQGIVRGQPDCECKEGCAGDPFAKCDCSGNIFNLDHLQNSKYFHMLAMLSQ